MWARLGISYDQFIRTTAAAPQAGVQRAHRAHLRAQPRRLLREGVRGLVLRGLRVVQAGRRDRRRASACCIRRARWSGWRSATGSSASAAISGLPARAASRAARVLQPESRRNEMLALLDQGLEDISASRSRFAWGVPFPQPLVDRRDADDVRLVRRAAQLPHRHRLSGRGLRGALARAAARRRQGHHALPRVIWPAMLQAAGLAAAASGLGARLRAARRRAVQQVGRGEARPRRGDRPLRRRCLPLLPAARGAVRRRRQLLVGAVRGALQRATSRTRGNLASRVDLDGRAVLRRRRAGGRAHDAGRRATRPTRRLPRGDGRHARLPAARGAAASSGRASCRGNEYVRPPGAVEAREGSGAARRAGDDARLARCGSSRGRRCSLAPFMPDKAQELWAQLGAPGAVADQRFDRRWQRSTRRAGG